MSHKAERRQGPGEIGLAVTKHDGVQVDSILIDQATFGQALRQIRASNFDLPVALSLQRPDGAFQIILSKPGVEADRLQRARDDPFRLAPPRRREGVFPCIPFSVYGRQMYEVMRRRLRAAPAECRMPAEDPSCWLPSAVIECVSPSVSYCGLSSAAGSCGL